MTLTTRLLLFHLGSLAVLLVGFSAALDLAAQVYLYGQADERLDAALNTLGAAVEVTPGGVEWEPHDRTLRLPDGVAWVVTDDAGRVVARSDRPAADDLLAEAAGRFRGPADDARRMHWRGERWQAGQRRFQTDGPKTSPAEVQPADGGEVKYPALVVTAALPLDPTRATLRALLWTLVGVVVAVLTVALIAGRWVCRRALSPVRRMAADARAVDPTDPARRVETPAAGDELTDLGGAFNGLLDRLHAAADRHRRFAGDASHQLRTPLAALLGQIEVALRRERSAGEYRDTLAAAHGQAARLARIVEALLFLTRAGAEAGVPHREEVDLAAWLPTHLEAWANHPRSADIRVSGADAPQPVATNPLLLSEVLNVLLDNALRYSAPSSPVTLSLSHGDGSIRLEVADRGPGVAATDLPQLFTPFFRTTAALTANREGVGLGLSIARRLAEALGGSLSVSSEEGEGSRFVVTLPAAG